MEIKYQELKDNVERETSTGQQEMADLCREFANEKSELIARHDAQVTGLFAVDGNSNIRYPLSGKATNELYRAHLGICGALFYTTPRWGNPAKCLS